MCLVYSLATVFKKKKKPLSSPNRINVQLFFLVLKLVNKNKGRDKEKGNKLQISFLKQRRFCKSRTYAWSSSSTLI